MRGNLPIVPWLMRTKNFLLRSGARGGLTLVETLAVFALIILLVALLVPFAQRARASALSAACVSNLRQVSQALLAYAADNGGTFPPFFSDAGNPGETHWQYVIGTRYLGEDPETFWDNARHSVIRCPADTTPCSLYHPPKLVHSFALNGSAFPGTEYGNPPWPEPRGVQNRKLGRIGHPSELCLVADGGGGAHTNEWGYSARLVSIGFGVDISWFIRHNGGMNCAMADGHVEWKSGEWILEEAQRDHNYRDSRFFDFWADF